MQKGEEEEAEQETGHGAGEEDSGPAGRTELGKRHARRGLVGVFALEPQPPAPRDGTQHPALSQRPEAIQRKSEANAEDDGVGSHRSSSGQVSKFVHQDEHTQGDEGNQSRHAFSASETSHCRALALLPILPGTPVRLRSPLTLAVLLAAGIGCGRAHDLEQGPYLVTIPADGVFRDDCNLASAGLQMQAQFTSFGDDVRLALVQQSGADCLALELVGQYQVSNQDFFADGTASNPLLEANGQLCQVNYVQFHVDAATVDPSVFSGVMRISYLASSPVACNCQFWFNFQATLCTPPDCPAVPTECS
jgi:hypothetical protein